MNRGQLRAEVRKKGRINKMTADSVLDAYLDEAAKQFAKETGILLKTVSFVVREKFDLTLTEAFKLTVTKSGGYIKNGANIVVAAALTDATGSAVAVALQTAIGSAVTVVYDTSTRRFTMAHASALTWKIEPPASVSYYDAGYKLFGAHIEATASGSSFTGDAAPYCTREFKLPTDFIEIEEIVWSDDYDWPLQPEIRRKASWVSGTPEWFSIYEKAGGAYIRFSDYPTTRNERFELTYSYYPAAITTGSAGDSQSFNINSLWDYALIYYATHLWCMNEGDDLQRAFSFRALFKDQADECINYLEMRHGGGFDLTQRGRTDL